MINYGYVKEINDEFDAIEQKVTAELANEGFGVLTRIDIQKKFKEKLGLDFKKYIILGACNSPNAYKALSAEDYIGLMLPCNIVIYEENSLIHVGIVKPIAAMGMIDNPELGGIASIIEEKLKSVFERL